MSSYHTPAGGYATAMDLQQAGLKKIANGMLNLTGVTRRARIYTRGNAVFIVPEPVPKQRSHARDRTRSKRWLAGSRRIKKAARLARAQGRRSPYADQWRGWEPLGCTTDSS